MRIGLGQFNTTVGDLAGNAESMRKIYEQAVTNKVDLLLFPELALCGYPPEDLLLKKHFLRETKRLLDQLACGFDKLTAVVGFAAADTDKCYNAAAVISQGKVQQTYYKTLLPNYGVFDEIRYFKPGSKPVIIEVAGVKTAITICEDIWDLPSLSKLLGSNSGIKLICNISASPYHMGKRDERNKIVTDCAKTFNSAVAYCNLVGGQDELIFDGQSVICDSNGKIACIGKGFEEDLLIADVQTTEDSTIITAQGQPIKMLDSVEKVYKALVLGTRDYMHKNGFKSALIGLSGGVDSSLVAAIAADALGPEHIIGVTMPSRFNSAETISDAEKLAVKLGIEFHTIPIEPVLEKFSGSLSKVPGWNDHGIAYENLQARIRGTILMSLSNQLNAIVLTTGNKSETAVGYSTLYGDTAGGFAVIKDVLKTLVYKLSAYVNQSKGREIIPESVINRPPSAELRDDQRDSDSLPDYAVLDEILKGYVEQDKSAMELVSEGIDRDIVRKIIRLVDVNEYKRRQSPPGIKITPKAFGRDRRLPITNRFDSTAI